MPAACFEADVTLHAYCCAEVCISNSKLDSTLPLSQVLRCPLVLILHQSVKLGSILLQAVLGGNSSPSADDINKILSSVGIEADSDRVEGLLKELEGKDITEVIASGVSKLASVPAGGGAVAASGGNFSC